MVKPVCEDRLFRGARAQHLVVRRHIVRVYHTTSKVSNMTNKTRKTKFWVVLAIINITAMIYPVSLYIQADSSDAQLFAAIALLGVAFLLVITDSVSAIVAYMQ